MFRSALGPSRDVFLRTCVVPRRLQSMALSAQPVVSTREAPLFSIPPQTHKIAHPEKDHSEDALFMNNEGTLFGVADGVGSWSRVGVDAALYSQSILQHTQEFLENDPSQHLSTALAYAYTQNVAKKIAGSTTVCLAQLRGRELHALNLGDSGFMIVRNGNVMCKTKEQSHAFNYPYQLGIGGDTPDKAQVWHSILNAGDMIVMGSDGFFDNLFHDEILEIIKSSAPDKIAWNLGFAAFASACSQQKSTPFAERVQEETDEIWSGGKMDDISVLVSVVK